MLFRSKIVLTNYVYQMLFMASGEAPVTLSGTCYLESKVSPPPSSLAQNSGSNCDVILTHCLIVILPIKKYKKA